MGKVMKNLRWKTAIEAMKVDVETLSMCKRLCSPIAMELAIKYNLRGSLSDAIKQLKEKAELFKKNPNDSELDEMERRVLSYRDSAKDDPYRKGMMEAIQNNDSRKLHVIEQKLRNKENQLHKNKECICFVLPEGDNYENKTI